MKMNILAFFSSIVKLIEIFCQLNKAADIEETFSIFKTPVADPWSLTSQHLFLPTGDNVHTFDFIVVGGGTSGSVAAKRLAEFGNGTFKVLLLALGSDSPPQTLVPAFFNRYFNMPEISLTYTSVSRREEGGVGGFKIRLGKVLGGTGVWNGIIFNRGHPEDYNSWANITEDPSWRYESLLKYFKRMETYDGHYPDSERGTEGPMGVTSRQDSTMGISTETWLNAGKEIGIPSSGPNGPQKISFTPYELNMKHGRRSSSFAAYIGHKKAIENLKIITYANVTKVLFDKDKRATGVEYNKHGVTFVAKATKEVILTAGVFGTPKILLNSGVGPADHLKDLNIPLISDVPVGKNLVDHPIMSLYFTLNDPAMVFGPREIDYEEALQEFQRESPIGQINNSRYPVTLDTPSQEHEKEVVQMMGVVSLGRPRSFGSVRLNGSDLYGHPIIDHRYYTDPQDYDKKVTIEAIKKLVSIFEETKTYKEFGAQFKNLNLPACEKLKFRSEEYWWCYVKGMARSGNHNCGTAKMGRIGDPSAVVDSQLKVIGVKGLRVLDSSVFPAITNANIQAAILVVAEKGAAHILADHSSVSG